MAEKNGFLTEQEKQANKLAAQVMQITFLFFTFDMQVFVFGHFAKNKQHNIV